ncbi:hypothetical protein DSECCO2_627820 [anaerobic digester metagenome]
MCGVSAPYSPSETIWTACGSVMPESFIPATSRKKFGRDASMLDTRSDSLRSRIASGTMAMRSEKTMTSSTIVVMKRTPTP